MIPHFGCQSGHVMLSLWFFFSQLAISLSTPSPTYSECGFDNNTYVCTCQTFSACQSYQFICPDNYDCHIKCVADSACYNTHIQWPLNGNSTLTCTGWRGACLGVNFPIPNPYKDFVYNCDLEAQCANAKIYCPLYADCHIICSGPNSCHQLKIFWSNSSTVESRLTCNGTNDPCRGIPTITPTTSPTTLYPTTSQPTFYPTTTHPTTLTPTTLTPTTTYPTTTHPTTNEPTHILTNEPTHSPTEFNSRQVSDNLNDETNSEEEVGLNNSSGNDFTWVIYICVACAVLVLCCIFVVMFLKKRRNSASHRPQQEPQKAEHNFSTPVPIVATYSGNYGSYNYVTAVSPNSTSMGLHSNEMITFGAGENTDDIVNVVNMTKDADEGAHSTTITNQTLDNQNDNEIVMDVNRVTVGNNTIGKNTIVHKNTIGNETTVDSDEFIINGETDSENDKEEIQHTVQ